MQENYTYTSCKIKIGPQKEMTLGKQFVSKVRDERIDAVKYWLIVLVIAVHVLLRPEFSDSTACVILRKWIHIFAMQLFIFISGYFSRKKDKKDLWPSLWKLIEPLIIFQVIALLFYVDSITIKKILSPWFSLWYLLSLIFWRLLLQIIPDRILKHTIIILIATFCISILAGFLPFSKVLSLQRTLAFMPFFFLGYYMKGKNLYLPDRYKLFCMVFLILMFAVPLFFPQYIGDLRHAHPYVNIYGAVKRMIVFTLSIPMSIAFINICYKTPWIARQGRLTMQYYIYHALLIPPLMVLLEKLNVPMTFASAVIIIIGITIGIGLVLYIPYFKTFTNPSLFFAKKKIKS